MRSCDDCVACCHALAVDALNKPGFTNCAHCHHCHDEPASSASDRGCEIYRDRPNACRDYSCLWLQGHLGDHDRPDRIGVIFTMTDHPTLGNIPMLIECHDGALDRPRIRQAASVLAAAKPLVVLSRRGGQVIIPRDAGESTQPAATPAAYQPVISCTVSAAATAA